MSLPPDLPSNSRMQRREIKKIVQGNVGTKHRPFLTRLFEDMLPGIGQYVIEEILIPAAKATLNDMVANGLEMMLYGEPQRRSHRRDRSSRGETYVSYDRQPARNRFDKPGWEEEPVRHTYRSPSDVVIATREDAQMVLEEMVEIARKYEIVSVSDFYGMVGLEAEYTDNDIGWENLGPAVITRVRGGYCIDFPRTIRLN